MAGRCGDLDGEWIIPLLWAPVGFASRCHQGWAAGGRSGGISYGGWGGGGGCSSGNSDGSSCGSPFGLGVGSGGGSFGGLGVWASMVMAISSMATKDSPDPPVRASGACMARNGQEKSPGAADGAAEKGDERKNGTQPFDSSPRSILPPKPPVSADVPAACLRAVGRRVVRDGEQRLARRKAGPQKNRDSLYFLRPRRPKNINCPGFLFERVASHFSLFS